MSRVFVHLHRTVTLDSSTRRAAGIVFLTDDERVLLIKRAPGADHAGTWGLPAGGVEPGETDKQAAIREAAEEVAVDVISPERMKKIWDRDGFTCFVLRCPVFRVVLNHEHTAHTWARVDELPSPLHPNVAAQIAAACKAQKERT